MKKISIYIFIFFLWCLSFIYGGDAKIIKEPAPIFSGLSNAKQLTLEKSIENIGDKEYDVFAGIQSIALDESGNYYILDKKHETVIKLNHELKFITSIGKKGEGPGEFRAMSNSINAVSVGLDKKLYVVNFMDRRIKKFSLDGKHITDLKFEQFLPFKVMVDENENLYLPSIKQHIIDAYDLKMNYKGSFLPGSALKTFLFFEHPACVSIRRTIPGFFNIEYAWLRSKKMALLNQFDLSITIFNTESGKVLKKFYLWDDFILSEFKIKVKRVLERINKTRSCGYVKAFLSLFIDHEENLHVQFLDSQNNQFLYKFSSNGELRQVYIIEAAAIDGFPKFFQVKRNKFYSYSNYAIHIFKEK
jgi:hypothetical protein